MFSLILLLENDFKANAIYNMNIAIMIVFKYLSLEARLVASPPGMENKYIPSVPS